MWSVQTRVIRQVVRCLSSSSVTVAMRALNMLTWNVMSPTATPRLQPADPSFTPSEDGRLDSIAKMSSSRSSAGGHGILWTLTRDLPALRRQIRDAVQTQAQKHWHKTVRK